MSIAVLYPQQTRIAKFAKIVIISNAF